MYVHPRYEEWRGLSSRTELLASFDIIKFNLGATKRDMNTKDLKESCAIETLVADEVGSLGEMRLDKAQ